ncbi:Asp/Glu/Hydantoin racemase-domain-containing protein [Bisporella sp. PMI_857]|nr:Asp/Glu/Hydantoin racemase-domain-containing protein [Bisporella sp. PMI_857]
MTTFKAVEGHNGKQRLLLINPNSTSSMTHSLQRVLSSLGPSPILDITYYTAPSGPTSINSNEDATESADVVIRDLLRLGFVHDFDAFLVACYSVHPLVSRIREHVQPNVPVTGIFEASISAALMLLPQHCNARSGNRGPRGYETFGIISTGNYWEQALTEGVLNFLGVSELGNLHRFKGVRTTGLSATELHDIDQDTVKSKVKDATRDLLRSRDCGVVILGCAGMVGMENWVRKAAAEELGDEESKKIVIVDGVKSGLVYLEGVARVSWPRETGE